MAQEGDNALMKIWLYAVIGIFLVATYYLLQWLFDIAIFVIILYVIWRVYDFIQRMRTPHGKRIKHTRLKGFLKQKYGNEGGKIYKDMVHEMRKSGYR